MSATSGDAATALAIALEVMGPHAASGTPLAPLVAALHTARRGGPPEPLAPAAAHQLRQALALMVSVKPAGDAPELEDCPILGCGRQRTKS